MAEIKGIAGAKNNGGNKDNGQNRGTEIASVAYMKILLALSEGQIAGQFTGQDICLDGTPLLDADGHENFPGVTWEWRSGLVDQDYIQGFPAVENEISVSTEIKSGTPWVKAINNTQLSAVRLRIKFPNGVYSLRDSGGKDGYRIEFAIDVSTDGSTYTEYGRDTVDGIANTGYERSYRIDLPRANSGWQIRVRRLTENNNNNKTADVSRIESITEIVDAKLRYPNTALLFVQFDSTLFDGRTPTVTVKAKGLVIRVPSNYDPVERTYSGSWDGTFNWAWSNNPAWIFYDLVLNKRYGLGKRISSDQVDKWTLYQIGQYCDAPVSDGAGGKEARYLCDLYISQRTDAWTVLMDLANIFRGMISWSNNLLSVDADMPREMDPDFVFNKSNIVGSFTFSSTSERTNYSAAIVTYSNPQNNYQDDQASVYSQEIADRFGFNTIELSRIGCTRESEAQRHGAYAIETNRDDNGVEFKTGMEGRIPRVGKVIGINNAPMAGRQNGGRVAAVSGKRITLDRAVAAKAGDTLIINLPDGKSQGRKVQGVQDRIVTVEQEYNPAPQAEAGWILDQSDLAIQQFRVKRVVNNNDGTVTINGLPYNPNKFPRVDDGAVIEDRPVTVVPPRGQEAPDDITISSLYRVSQGIGITTLVATWSPVKNAIAYEMQWRQNNGDWINLPRTGNTRFEVDGIYTGRYVVRVRAINAQDIASVWGISKETELTGKSGAPLPPLALATRSLVHGVQVSWEFPTGSGDTLRTELQYSKNQDGSAPMLLSDVAYPGKSYQQMGLSMGAEFWYRARLVDRLGNESPWTGWVQGMASDNFDDYYENLTDAIKDTAAWEETQRTISETQEGIRNTQQELEQTAEALRKEAEDQAKQVSQDIEASAKSITADVDGKIFAVNKTITDEITSVNEALDSGLAQANKGVQEAKSAVADANKQIATVNKSLTDSITQVRQSVTDTAAEINATIDLEIARVNKTLADGDAALNAQIKTAENGLKQSLSQVNTTLTSAVKQETADRIADVNAKAAQAADELLAATQGIEASIESLTQVMKTADENLAREMSSLAAGANIQFDSQVIWHFNNQTTEGWTGSAGVPGVSQDGWLRPADSATDPYITSPGGLAVDGAAYRFIMLRFRKTGKPVWAGEIRWVSAGENFNNTKRYIVAEPEYADGVATLTVRDIPWTGNIDRIRLDLTNQQDASNFIEFDWIAVGRPAPGASTAALQDVRSTLSNALTAEAQARSTLAAQMRGSYDGSDLEKVTSGLLYQEKTARVTAISAEVKARESLQTQFNDNKAAVSGELSSLTTEQSAQASRIGGLETSLGKKADAAALTSLTQKVEQQGATLTSQGAALTSLTNRVGQTETGLAGTNEALSGLQSVVTRQGDRITSQGQSITKLTSDLGTTNAALAKKAEAAAVTALTQQVEQNGRDIRSNTDSITSLSNQLVNGQPNRWSRRLYPVQLANAGTVPSFSDVRAVAPTVVDEVADAAKLDFTSAGSYLIALYSCQVKVAADTTITLAPGARVFDDTGAIFVNGVQVAWGNASWNTVSFELKGGWNTVEFLVNQWTGQAYINLGLKLSDKVAEMYSGLGVSALANAAGVLSSNVSQIGNEVVSNSQSITQLRNALTQTDVNVASKADQTAMNSLTGRVEKTESGLTAANANITSLKSAVRAGNASGGDLIPNPTFDPAYDQMGFSVVSTTAEEVPPGCPYGYAARIASRDHHPNFAAFPATLNDVIEISALVACGAGTANFNLYVGTAVRPDTSTGAPLMAGGGKSPSATWQRTTWRFKVTQAMVDRGYIRPFLQISQNSPYGTVWFVTDWHMRNVTAAQKVQDTADATAAAVDSLTTTVTQQGNLLTSTGNRTTQLENGLATTNAAVAKKADATAVQDLTNTVTQLGNDLTAANSAITKLTGNLANTDKALAQKADATALATLDTKVTQQGKTLESQSNSLTNLSNSLSQVAADIDASGQIPGNLVVNPSFERGLDGYTGRSTATSVVEVSAPHSGTRALKVDPGSVSPGQYIPFVQGRTYEIGVWVKEPGATTDNGAGNNKLRIGNSAGQPVFERPYNSGTVGTNWTLVSGRWKATETASLPVTLSNYLINGSRYFDDFYVTDVTDRVDIDATAGAVTGLTSRVSTAEGAITSQSQQLTNLQNSLNTTNNNVAQKASAQSVSDLTSRVTSAEGKITSQGQAITKLQGDLSSTTDKVNTKADQTALNALTGRVEKTEAGLTAANSNIVSLTAAVNAGNAAGDDYIPNPSFDPAYDRMGYDVVETTAAGVPADCPFRYAVRLAGRDHVPKINNIAVTPGDVYEMSALVACGTGSADFNFYIGRATTATGGIGARASGGNTKTTTAWKRATWRFTVPADTNFLRPFLQVNQSSPFGTVWYAADWHMRNVTAANSAQKTADATAKAVDSLTTTVSQQGDTLSSIGTRTTSLENSLRSTNDTVSKKADTTAVTQLQGTVTQQGNDIAAANSALTKLSSDLATTNANVNKKADASAMNTLQNQVTEQGKTLSAQGDSLTQLSNSLSQTAADIDASGKMPGNLIVNGSFERGAAGFTGWSSTATVADLQVPHSGNKALKMSAGQSNLVGQEISITQGRTYRMGVWAKQDPGTTIKDAGNTKFRVADSTGLLVGSNYGPFSSGWQLVTFDWKATKTTTASFQLTTFLSAGAMYFDDFHVLDVTDEKDIAANAGAISQMNTRVTAAEGAITTQAQQLTKLSGDLAVTNAAVSKKAEQSAVTGLTTRMTSAEGKLDSQSQQLTSLQNSLTTMNTELGKKADTSAVSSLTGRVSQVENTITSQSQSITSLTSTINTIRTQGANPWVDGTFESYSDGQVLGGNGTAVVVASQKFTGNKSLQVSRGANNNGNSDKQLGSWQSVREDAKFRFEFWAMMPADQAPSSGWTTLVGIQSQNAAGQNAWQAAVTVSEASLGARDKWVKFTGIASNNGAGRTRAVVWISTRGATGNGTPGYSLYIDDLVITDVTDAKAAQDASDATASAVSGLTARVTDAEGKITAQAQQQTALATKVDNANSRVDNMAKTLSDSQSTQASLNTSLQSQIDAQAAANIKNQTTLDNTIKSVASITSTQQTHATALEALATQQTTLTSSVGDLSASVQNTAKTVADVNGTVSSLWSMKVETVNGKNVGAGITLGSNGETSDMILYADRFSLFNRNNATAVPVMIAEGNELYIDTARIKNSSLTSTKIADGSITNAKIGNEIRSNNFVDGSQGWRIAKDGSSQFNNVIVRGRVEANSGVFRGTVQADAFIGDIAVAKGYDSLTFRRNQTVQRNGAYQNRGYSMTVVLACTLVCQTYGTGSGLGYTSDITFNIGGQEVTRRIFVDAGNITAGTTAFELRFAARLDADYNNVGFFIKATGRNAAIDYTCTVENITATAFRTDSSSFS
ncbi:TipJ family phage tail tip protein [Klebsiella pneumoniae]